MQSAQAGRWAKQLKQQSEKKVSVRLCKGAIFLSRVEGFCFHRFFQIFQLVINQWKIFSKEPNVATTDKNCGVSLALPQLVWGVLLQDLIGFQAFIRY